jgi:hypothetical protein
MILTLAQTEHDKDTTVVLVMYSVQMGGYCMSCKISGSDGRLSSNFKDLSSTHTLPTVNGQTTSDHIPTKYSHISASVAHRKKSTTIWHSPVREFFSVSSNINHRISVALFQHKMPVHNFNG